MTSIINTYIDQQRWLRCFNASESISIPSFSPVYVSGVANELDVLPENLRGDGSNHNLIFIVGMPSAGYYERLKTRSVRPPGGLPFCEEYIVESYHKRITGWFGVTNDQDIEPLGSGLMTMDYPCVARCKGGGGHPTYLNDEGRLASYFGPVSFSSYCFPGPLQPIYVFTESIAVLYDTGVSLEEGTTLCVVRPDLNTRTNEVLT